MIFYKFRDLFERIIIQFLFREQPSVAAIIDPFSSAPRKDFYWGSKQIFVPSKKTN